MRTPYFELTSRFAVGLGAERVDVYGGYASLGISIAVRVASVTCIRELSLEKRGCARTVAIHCNISALAFA